MSLYRITCFAHLSILGISKEEESVQAHREMKRERNRQKLDSYVPQRLGACETTHRHKGGWGKREGEGRKVRVPCVS